MSSTARAPYAHLGKGGDYPVELNYAIRIYTPEESIPEIGTLSATLKGGQRTNHHGEVPLLNGKKKIIGLAEIIQIVSAKPKYMPLEHITACGFNGIDDATKYVQRMHKEEFKKDEVWTVFYYKITQLHEPKELK